MQHPFTALISGPTGCGKTQFTKKLVKHASEMISPPPQEIVWCYGVYQDVFNTMDNVRFIEGLPSETEFDGIKRVLLVIDDLMHEANTKKLLKYSQRVVITKTFLYYFSPKTYFTVPSTVGR